MVKQERLNELFYYENGYLYWKILKGNRKNPVGSSRPDGYLTVMVDKKRHLVHRLIYQIFNGFTDLPIDHIDRNRKNNKIENLRPLPHCQNSINTGPHSKRASKSSKYKGVSIVPYYRTNRITKSCKPWRVRMSINGKPVELGRFKTEEDAAMFFNYKSRKIYGNLAFENVSEINNLSTDEILSNF